MIKRVVLDLFGAFLIVLGSINLFNSIPGLNGFTIFSELVSKPIGGLLGAVILVLGCVLLLTK